MAKAFLQKVRERVNKITLIFSHWPPLSRLLLGDQVSLARPALHRAVLAGAHWVPLFLLSANKQKSIYEVYFEEIILSGPVLLKTAVSEAGLNFEIVRAVLMAG